MREKKFEDGKVYRVVESGIKQKDRTFKFKDGKRKPDGKKDNKKTFHFRDGFVVPKQCEEVIEREKPNGIDYTKPKKACENHRNQDYTLCRRCNRYVSNEIIILYAGQLLCPKCFRKIKGAG